MGGRIGYSAATGLMVIVLSWFGIISLLLALVPVVAISPILLYIGMLIGAQAFQTTPNTHAPAIVLALTPHLAAWCKTLDGRRARCRRHQRRGGRLRQARPGRRALSRARSPGGGAILTGLVLGAIGAFVIDEEVRGGGGLRARRCGADLLRLHARRVGRIGGHADGRGRLCDRGGLPVRPEPRWCNPASVPAGRRKGDDCDTCRVGAQHGAGRAGLWGRRVHSTLAPGRRAASSLST